VPSLSKLVNLLVQQPAYFVEPIHLPQRVQQGIALRRFLRSLAYGRHFIAALAYRFKTTFAAQDFAKVYHE
jgi:hypothetical protein